MSEKHECPNCGRSIDTWGCRWSDCSSNHTVCLNCGTRISEHDTVCSICWGRTPEISTDHCTECGRILALDNDKDSLHRGICNSCYYEED